MSEKKSNTHKALTLRDVANYVIELCQGFGVKAYIWHVAKTGSVYIRFYDQRIGSVRIGDHDGREQYKYKYNIRIDNKHVNGKWLKEGDVWRFYVHVSKWWLVVPQIVDRAQKVKEWGTPAKYSYGIPKHKQNKN